MKYDVKIDNKVVINSFVWKILERIMSQGINIIVQIVLARILLPEHFGSLAIIVAITNYASIFVQSGLSTAIIQRENIDRIDVSTLLTSSLAVALVFYIGIFFAAPLISSIYQAPELTWALRVLAIILFLNAINSIQSAILSRKMAFKTLFFRSLIAVPISGAVGIIMAYQGYGIWALVIHNLLNMGLVVLFMSFDKELRIPLGFSLERAKQLYSFSVKIMLTSIVTGLHDLLRTMFIGKRYTKNDLAYYDKAYTYSNYITQTINTSMTAVLLPALSRKQTDILKLKQMTRRSVQLSAFIMIPMLLGVAAICRPFVRFILTSKWDPCVPYLMIFCVLRIPGCIMSIDKQTYYALGKSEINLYYEIGLFFVNIITLLFTIRISVLAIAIGATFVEIAGGVALAIISSKVFDYKIGERVSDIIRPTINSIVMFVVVMLIGRINVPNLLKLVIQIVTGIVVYLMLSLITHDENLPYCQKIISSRFFKH